MKKILLLTMILTTLLWPSVGMAQTGDQRCWRKESCTSPDTGGSFVKNKESIAACGGERDAAGLEIGFCLPISPAETAVSFGGKTVFTNVAEFFKYIYQYGIRIAGILSVFMLIVGGVQWLLSGGSPDRIGSAKKRISGAIIGLVIVLVSFTLLNILNPYLVELRVPNVWMINKLGMSPPACKHVEGKKIAVYRSVKEKMNEKQTEAKLKDAKFTIDPSTTTVLAKLKKDPSLAEYGGSVPRCGIEYFVQDAGTQTCLGYVCDKGYTCAPFTLSDDGKRNYSKAGCYTGQIHTYAHLSSAENVIKSSALPGVVQWFVRKLNDPDWVASVDDGFYIYSVCDDDSVGKYFDSEPKYIH